MGHGLRREILEHTFPDLPEGFVKWLVDTGRNKEIMESREYGRKIAELLKEWRRQTKST